MMSHMKTLAIACIVAFTGVSQAAGTWETTLLGRDINGNPVDGSSASAVFLYDTTLNVTWLRDANANGRMNLIEAETWASRLKIGTYSGWRLPTMTDTGARGCDFSYSGGTDCGSNVQTKSGDPAQYEVGQTVFSEMAQLWYAELGNKAYCPPGNVTCTGSGVPQPASGLTSKGDFQNMQADIYWSDLRHSPSPTDPWHYYVAWDFDMDRGGQTMHFYLSAQYALAVRPGDVAPLPEPETYALMLAGLGVVGFAARRRRNSATRRASGHTRP
jgi:hypothetical protein